MRVLSKGVTLMLALMAGGGWAADRVGTENGRIVLEDSSGKKSALTQTGFDSDPWISPDGRTVVFLRRPAEDMFRTSVYEIDLRTLIALKRHNDEIIGRPYFLYWLYSAAGVELGLAGVEDEDADVLRDAACQVPQSLPAPAPSRPLSTTVGAAMHMEESAMNGRLVTRVEPTYPNQAKSEHIQGDVRLQVRVGADGTVEEVNLVSGHPRLVQAAVIAVKKWKYRRVVSAGHPVEVVTNVTVRFRLPSTDR
ncbi:MAG: energy transducer TonB [Bryobacteraceae bacterium]